MDRDTFLKSIESKKAAGLVDVKFLVKHGESLSEEELMAASNRIDDAIKAGKCERTREWKKDGTAKKSDIFAQ